LAAGTRPTPLTGSHSKDYGGKHSKEDATALGAPFVPQEGEPRSTGEPGTLLVVDVADFRFLTASARYGLGIMIGNAFVQAKVSFRDLKTGEVWGEQSYDTSSTAWEGIFSAMTDKQVRAFVRRLLPNCPSTNRREAPHPSGRDRAWG